MKQKPKRWESTRVAGLYRHVQSGRFYARTYIAGKEKWSTLDTDVFSVAELRMRERSAEAMRVRSSQGAVEAGRATMGELAHAYLALVEARDDLKAASKAARKNAVARVRRTWPGFDLLPPKAVTLAAVQEWSGRLKTTGSGFTPPGAKTAMRGNSATAVNTAVDALRRILDLAVERGIVYANEARKRPVEGRLKKKTPATLAVSLPNGADLRALFLEIERGSGGAGKAGWGVEIADFCRFLAYSGARKAEAMAVTWAHVDWSNNRISIPGTKSQTSERIVPIFPALAELLRKIHLRRVAVAEFAVEGTPHVLPAEKILRVSEAQKSIDRACTALKLPRLTHHDLRHAFGTAAIEAGVDIPTVAKWMGHADGGALLMKTYSHLRDDHSQAQARKLAVGGAS